MLNGHLLLFRLDTLSTEGLDKMCLFKTGMKKEVEYDVGPEVGLEEEGREKESALQNFPDV